LPIIGHCMRCGQTFAGEFCPRCDVEADHEEQDRLGSFQVWHFRHPSLMDTTHRAARHQEARRLLRRAWCDLRTAYWIHVADVRAGSWEEAYARSNNSDAQPWYERPTVTLLLALSEADAIGALSGWHPYRSTSVGDVLVGGDQARLCLPAGWLDL